MPSYFQIVILAVIQGLCELLPVSSSAHVIVAERIMGLNPSAPSMTLLLVMLHTGTMFAVIFYFWKEWKRSYFSSWKTFWKVAKQLFVATFVTGIVGWCLKILIEKIFMRHLPHAEVEHLFSNLPLIAVALAAVGFLMIVAGVRSEKIDFFRNSTADANDGGAPNVIPAEAGIASSSTSLYTPGLRAEAPCPSSPAASFERSLMKTFQVLNIQSSCWIGLIQGFCLPFRGFSRSGSTISMGLLLGISKKNIEEFSFALAVVLTPIVLVKELHRFLQDSTMSQHTQTFSMLSQCGMGMVLSFLAGLVALKWLSRWLEGGHWKFFGFYCLFAAGGITILNHFFL
ncbi:MAG: undecaprenyl-diphosphate phosphatase [Chthoniobacterales bacterium]